MHFNSGKYEKGANRAGKGQWSKTGKEEKGSEEVREDEDELHAWCLLEESENEQWQEVTSKKSKLKKKKKLDHESLLSVENNSGVPPRKVVEVKDNWVNIRATLDTGAAGHVMPAEMFRECNWIVRAQQRNSLQQMEKGSKTWVRRPYHSSPWKECSGA